MTEGTSSKLVFSRLKRQKVEGYFDGGRLTSDAGAMLLREVDRRLGLTSARIACRDAAGRVADCHSLRHTFITNLAAGGVHPKIAQALARHSTITLTMDRYGHTVLGEQATALNALPDLAGGNPDRPSQNATGTDDAPTGDQQQSGLVFSLANRSTASAAQQSPSSMRRARTHSAARDVSAIMKGASGIHGHALASNPIGNKRQAAPGFEPGNNGFAIRRLCPLGYAAQTTRNTQRRPRQASRHPRLGQAARRTDRPVPLREPTWAVPPLAWAATPPAHPWCTSPARRRHRRPPAA